VGEVSVCKSALCGIIDSGSSVRTEKAEADSSRTEKAEVDSPLSHPSGCPALSTL